MSLGIARQMSRSLALEDQAVIFIFLLSFQKIWASLHLFAWFLEKLEGDLMFSGGPGPTGLSLYEERV